MKEEKIVELNKNDKRPIAKFYRCHLEDIANGVRLDKCRGINQQQFRVADRLYSNYSRAVAEGNRSGVIKATNQKGQGCNLAKFERQVDAMHNHRQVFDRLNAKSQAIIQHFCLDELPIRKFELSQVPQ